MKNIYYFFILIAYVFSAIFGIGQSLYDKSYVVAIGVVFLAILAAPEAWKYFKKLREGK